MGRQDLFVGLETPRYEVLDYLGRRGIQACSSDERVLFVRSSFVRGYPGDIAASERRRMTPARIWFLLRAPPSKFSPTYDICRIMQVHKKCRSWMGSSAKLNMYEQYLNSLGIAELAFTSLHGVFWYRQNRQANQPDRMEGGAS